MRRFLNRAASSAKRKATRTNIMANTRLLYALHALLAFREVSHYGLSRNAENAITRLNKEIRNAFRAKGHANVLPYARNKMINKLSNVAINAQKLLHERGKVPIPHGSIIGYGKRTNGRGPNVVVISPGK